MSGSGHDVFSQADSAFRAVLDDLPPGNPYSPLHRFSGARIGKAEGEGLWNWLLAKAHQLADEYRRRLDASCSARGFRDPESEGRMRAFFEARARSARPYLDMLIAEHNAGLGQGQPAPQGPAQQAGSAGGESYVPLSEAAEMFGQIAPTLSKWAKAGRIRSRPPEPGEASAKVQLMVCLEDVYREVKDRRGRDH
jgi:hypothetical protein